MPNTFQELLNPPLMPPNLPLQPPYILINFPHILLTLPSKFFLVPLLSPQFNLNFFTLITLVGVIVYSLRIRALGLLLVRFSLD